MNISKQAVLETIDEYGRVEIDNLRALRKAINALPSISDGWISFETLPDIDNKDKEFLCEDVDGYVVCWYKPNGFIECYTLMEVTPIRYKPLTTRTH